VSNRVSRRQAGRWAEQEQQQYAPPPQQYAAPPQQQYAPPAPVADDAPTGDELIAQLEKLGQLRDNGILTQAEFDAQKAKLLYR
jgi:hypothetical protein